MADAINNVFTNSARALDAVMSVQVHMPEGNQDNLVDFIARLEDVEMTPDVPARVIINERTGHHCGHSQHPHFELCRCLRRYHHQHHLHAGCFAAEPVQPGRENCAVASQTTTEVTENKTSMVTLPELPTAGEKSATALNSLGVTPRDMMAIFQAMKQAGALQADLVIR